MPADRNSVTFTTEITVVDRAGTPDYRGPAIHGRPGDRFIYLTWGGAVALVDWVARKL